MHVVNSLSRAPGNEELKTDIETEIKVSADALIEKNSNIKTEITRYCFRNT